MGSYAGKELQAAQFASGEAVQGAVAVSSPSVTYSASISASTDPFAGKSNPYAESNIVRMASTVAYHVRFGASDVGTAVTTDFVVPANVPVFFKVDKDFPYMRVIPSTGTASYWITEVY